MGLATTTIQQEILKSVNINQKLEKFIVKVRRECCGCDGVGVRVVCVCVCVCVCVLCVVGKDD